MSTGVAAAAVRIVLCKRREAVVAARLIQMPAAAILSRQPHKKHKANHLILIL
jgi:hypothetical protein